MRTIDVAMTAAADDGVLLAGTLTLPAAPGPHPAALILHGSGRLDRDGHAGRVRPQFGPQIAAALASRGIASFRYDRRGVGETPGDWFATGFLQNRADAAAALRALRDRPEVSAVAVLGHSEGSLHATWLAAHASPAAAVLLAPPLRPGLDAARWQGAMITRTVPGPIRRILGRLGNGQLARLQSSTADVLRVGGVRVNARWWREFLAQDPRADLPAIRVPLLAVTGDKDIQVDPEDLRALPATCDTRVEPGLTHILRRDPGTPSLRAYPRLMRLPVDEPLLTHVSTWLSQHLRSRATSNVSGMRPR